MRSIVIAPCGVFKEMGKGIRTASGEIIKLKTNFEVCDKLGAFYSGGPVQLSKDGQHIFTTCGNAVKVVSYISGRVLHSIEEDEDHVTCFAASDDGAWLVVGWRSLLLKQYNWKTGKCVRSWKGHTAPVMSMKFDTTSTLLATGSSDAIVNVWDCTKQYCTHNFRGSKGVVSLVKFHPDRKVLRLFTSSSDCHIRIWDLETSKCVSVLKNHVSPVTSLEFSADGQILLSGGRDQVVHVWELETRRSMKTLPVFECVEGLIVLPNSLAENNELIQNSLSLEDDVGKPAGQQCPEIFFATAGNKGLIRIWSTKRPHALHTLEPLVWSCDNQHREKEEEEGDEMEEAPGHYTGLHYSESVGLLAATTYDHNIVFFDSQCFKRLKQLIGYLDEVLDTCFVGKADSLLAVATNSEHVKVFERRSNSCQLLAGHSGIVLCLDASRDGTLLATGSKDNTIRVWKLNPASNQFECVAVGTGHTHEVGAVAISRVTGGFIASAGQDCTLKIWSLKSVLRDPQKTGIVKLKVKYTQLAHTKDINSLDVSPNDKLVVSGSQDKTAKLWQVADGNLLGTFRGHRRGLWCVKFSPVDQCVLTASGDGTIMMWAIGDFSCIKTFEGHTNSVLSVVFLTRGMQIASSGSDGLVKLWTIKTTECVATLDEHTEKIWSLAASSDGEMLVSGGADSVVCQWKDITEQVESQATADLELKLLQEQELSNLLHQKDYVKAVGVAITLDQPYRVFTILQELLEKCGPDGDFLKTIRSLRQDQMYSVLKYASRWNQNARHCNVAQSVVGVVLREYSSEELVKMEDMGLLLEGLIPYTERHFRRLSRLQQLSKFVDYTLQCMKLPTITNLNPPSDDNADAPEHQVAMETDLVFANADSTTTTTTVQGANEEKDCSEDVAYDQVTSTMLSQHQQRDSCTKTKLSRRSERKKILKDILKRKRKQLSSAEKETILKISKTLKRTRLL